MRVFLDTEFTDFVGVVHDPALISIGLVTEDGKYTFYVELTDNYTEDMCSYFVIENVLPLLDAPPLDSSNLNLRNINAKATISECRKLLKAWIGLFDEQVQVCCDAPNYDWAFFKSILDGDIWPQNLASNAEVIDSQDSSFKETSDALYHNDLFRCHHALDDALVMQKTWAKISFLIS